MHHDMNEMSYDTQNTIAGSLLIFLAGVAVGAAAAIMYAPQPGAVTRAQLAEKTTQFKDRVSEVSNQVAEKATQIKDRIATQASDTLHRAAGVMEEKADSMSTASSSSDI
jgi:gas vesicle protein